MAFGSSRRGGSGASDAGVVRITADTGQANQQINEFERNTIESYRAMSREALKLDLANERVVRTVNKYGAESRQAKAATIALKDAEEAAARATDRLGREHAQASRQTDVHRRSMLGLAGSVSGVVGLFGGAYGLVSVLGSSVKAAREAEVVTAQLANAVRRAGLDYEQQRKQIEATLQAQAKLSSFDDEQLAQSFTNLVRRTKDVNEALRLNALAANVARGRNIELDAASNIVLKAYNGQVGGLRRLGIELDKNATATQAIAKLQQSYGQSAAEFAKTSEGAQQRFNKVLGDSKEIIGTALLPVVNEYLSKGAEWLEQMNESGELQAKVNGILEDAGQVVRGFAGAVRTVKGVVDPLVESVGGLDDAVRLLLIGMAVSKLVTFAGALRGVASAAGAARTQIGLLNRTPVAPGGGGGRGGGAGLIGIGAAAVSAFGLSTASSEDAANRAKFAALSSEEKAQALRQITKEAAQQFFGVSSSEYDRLVRGTAPLPVDFSANGLIPTTPAPATTPDGFAQMGGATPESTTPAGAGSSRSFALQLARATTDQQRLRLLIGQRAYLERKVAEFQRKGFGQAELRFRGELDSVRGQITGIFSDRASAREAAQQEADARAEAQRQEAEARRVEAAQRAEADRQERISIRRERLSRFRGAAEATPTLRDDIKVLGQEIAFVRQLRSQTKRGSLEWEQYTSELADLGRARDKAEDTREQNMKRADDKARAARVMREARKLGIRFGGPGAGGPVMAAQDPADTPLAIFRRASFEFLGQLQGTTNQYGSNFAGAGRQVTIVNQWPQQATDLNQWGIYQRHAIERAGMVG